MLTTREQKIVFCCAIGEFRSINLQALVPGSDTIRGGYVAEAISLCPKKESEQIYNLNLFYGYTFLALIADQEDYQHPPHANSLDLMLRVLSKTKIVHKVFPYIPLWKAAHAPQTYLIENI